MPQLDHCQLLYAIRYLSVQTLMLVQTTDIRTSLHTRVANSKVS